MSKASFQGLGSPGRSQLTRRRLIQALAASPAALAWAARAPATALERADGSLAGFPEPSSAARPRVWWHWMDGNVSEAGITKDLAWMRRAGIGGVQVFDGGLHTPQIVAERKPYLSTAWKSAFRHAVDEARAGDLEFTIASSPGWSETGGPWVRPEQAMKKLVWSEIDVTGGRNVALELPSPPDVSGPFQDVPGGGAEPSQPPPPGLPTLYGDSRVIAYRLGDAEAEPRPVITASSDLDVARLRAGERTTFQSLATTDSQPGWVEFAHASPVTRRAVELVLQPGPRIGPIYPSWPIGRIEAGDDGVTWRKIADLPERGAPQQTVAFPETRARRFRLVLEPRWARFPVPAFAPAETPVPSHGVARVVFLEEARVHRFEDKAGWSTVPGLAEAPTPEVAAEAVVRGADVLDITAARQVDGTLRWAAPPGRWRILRLGWSLTGKLNNPPSDEGSGLEVDKLSRRDVSAYLDAYLGYYEQALETTDLAARGLGHMLTDSYEAMAANWTPDVLDAFRQRRGYDPTPWTPALTGRVVESAEASDRFLWDFRRTLADLIAEAHYGVLSEKLAERGMGRYGEAHEALRAFVGDGMEVKKSATVPMGATWAMPNAAKLLPDILESASVAHLYGQNIVAAESFTALAPAYGFDPAALKPYADKMMANGVNRFVIHTSVHQPDDEPGPGLGLGPVGQWFTRKETWAEMARPWIDYLARSSDLLQQGRFVADIALFYGEDDNITAVYSDRAPVVPAGHAFDLVNGDVVRNLLRMDAGGLSAPHGARYRLLALDPTSSRMTLPTLRRLDALSRDGLILTGPMPEASPSLSDDPAEFARLARAVWSRSGRTFPRIADAVQALRLSPDVVLGHPRLAFVHRRLDEADIYYVANLSGEAIETKASFRVTGKAAEVWRADDGSANPATYVLRNGRTEVPLSFGPHDALFVVFRRPTQIPAFQAPSPRVVETLALGEEWLLKIDDPSVLSEAIRLQRLISWTESERPTLKYHSGIGRYVQSVTLKAAGSGERLLLDLGQVANVAEVAVNGRTVGVAWKPPYRLDVTEHVKEGRNDIEVAVANLWPNRLIGDRQPEPQRPPVQAPYNPYTSDSPLTPSGLLGPVRILRRRTD